MPYTDKALALTAVKSFPATRRFLTAADDAWLDMLLTDTAGVNAAGQTIYRVCYVVALAIDQSPSNAIKRRKVEYTTEIEYSNNSISSKPFYDCQAREDLTLGLTVPEAYLATGITGKHEIGRQRYIFDRDKTGCLSPEDLEDRFISSRAGRGRNAL